MELIDIKEERELKTFYKERWLETQVQKVAFLKKIMDIIMENWNPKEDLFMLEGLVLSGGWNYFKNEKNWLKLVNCDAQAT
jgi:hypothetical protein